MVYRHARKDEGNAHYKEIVNAVATESRKSKRSYEQQLDCNIKKYSKSCYAYIKSKQNLRDKVGPLEGNIK